MSHSFFTSEAVSVGHPDKIADQISDVILDACLEQDPESRVACETMVCPGLIVLGGEITTRAKLHVQELVRETIKRIGYDNPDYGMDYRACGILTAINRQSEDISLGVTEGKGLYKELGAGDQGMMFGYACSETEQLMPLPFVLAHELMGEFRRLREEKVLSYLRPDGKSQVTVQYDAQDRPVRVDAVVISAQHDPDAKHSDICRDMEAMARRVIPGKLMDAKTRFYINPSGRFVQGGPAADCGLTGRKIMVDTYGSMGRHGGGCFSGKDPTKVDRSGAYAARYVAKNIVAAGLARRCEVQLAYALGVPHPVCIKVDTFGTSHAPVSAISEAIPLVFSLSPKGIIEMLDLLRPIYAHTAYGGHFGREDLDLPWESTDRVEALRSAVEEKAGLRSVV